MEIYNRKAVSYMTHEAPGDWRGKVLFLTDNGFEKEADDIISVKFPSSLAINELRFIDFPFIDNFYWPEDLMYKLKGKCSPACTESIVEKLTEGCLIWEYFGHGAPNVLGHERVFFGGGSKFSDVRKLKNGLKLPFLIAWTCDTGRFDYSEEKWHLSIGEDLMFSPDGGTIGQIVSSGRGYPYHHVILSRGVHEAFFTYDVLDFGSALTLGKILFASESQDDMPQEMFLLQGDPALKLALPKDLLSVSIKPEQFQSGKSSSCSVRVGSLPDDERKGFKKGNFDVQVVISGGDKKEFLRKPQKRISPKGRKYSLNLEEDIQSGDGSVSVYYSPRKAGSPGYIGGSKITIEPDPETIVDSEDLKKGEPNLTINLEDISFSNFSPKSGETIFIDVTVHNEGDGMAQNVKVKVFDSDPNKGGKMVTNLVDTHPKPIKLIRPGKSGSTRVRWDPSRNAGEHDVWVVVDSGNRIKETNEGDNRASRKIVVKEKVDLIVTPDRITMVPKLDGSWNVDFKVRNEGEITAENVIVKLKAIIKSGSEEITQEVNLPIQFISPKKSYRGKGITLPEGLISLTVHADPEDMIDEVTHKNNKATLTSIEVLRKLEEEKVD